MTEWERERLARLADLALRFRCIFCGLDCSGLDGLRKHSAVCPEHPLAREVARLRTENERLKAAVDMVNKCGEFGDS